MLIVEYLVLTSMLLFVKHSTLSTTILSPLMGLENAQIRQRTIILPEILHGISCRTKMVESVGQSMSNAMCTRFTVIGVCILSIAGCRRTPPEVRSFFSFSEFQMPNNSDRRLLFEHTKSIATRTDAFRQREIARFLRDNRIADVTALLEYETRYFTGSIYTVIVIQ